MADLREFGSVLLYRLAAKSPLPVSWFRSVDPAAVARHKRRGRLHLEIVSHCWRYERFLTYQLSSLVHHPAVELDVTMTVYYCPEDDSTEQVLRYFGGKKVPGLAWSWRPLPKEKLFRRAIGRNHAAKHTGADWIWFTDADIVFQENCLDALAGLLQGRDDALVFPETTFGTALLPDDDPLFGERRDGPALLALPQSAFPLRHGPYAGAKGAFQITHGDIARGCGYCETIPLFQRPANHWRKTYDDSTFRWLVGTPGTPLDLPGVCQIRHIAKGRYGDGAFSSAIRGFLRKQQDRGSGSVRDCGS